ncbi:hypothetical protein DFH06DRAFT_1140131 [Mycena polygramma]|nr:hypothetical protein DFH06DRAFT_1140131 [Mycena polygramma]
MSVLSRFGSCDQNSGCTSQKGISARFKTNLKSGGVATKRSQLRSSKGTGGGNDGGWRKLHTNKDSRIVRGRGGLPPRQICLPDSRPGRGVEKSLERGGRCAELQRATGSGSGSMTGHKPASLKEVTGLGALPVRITSWLKTLFLTGGDTEPKLHNTQGETARLHIVGHPLPEAKDRKAGATNRTNYTLHAVFNWNTGDRLCISDIPLEYMVNITRTYGSQAAATESPIVEEAKPSTVGIKHLDFGSTVSGTHLGSTVASAQLRPTVVIIHPRGV